MKSTVLLFAFFLIAKMSFSQNLYFEWVSTVSGYYVDAYNIGIDRKGNIYTQGRFNGDVDFDPGNGVNRLKADSLEVYMTKSSSSGNLIWAKKSPGGSSPKFNKSNNMIVSGSFGETTDFDMGTGKVNRTPKGNWDIFTYKADSDGNLIWVQTTGGTDRIFINGFNVDHNGNIINVGHFEGTVDLDPGPTTLNFTATNQEHGFIQKLDSNGNLLWAGVFPGNYDGQILGLAIDNEGSIFMCGNFVGSIDFDLGPGNVNRSTIPDDHGFLVKLDSNGAYQWVSTWNGTTLGNHLTIDNQGDVYNSSTFEGVIDIDPGPASLPLTSDGFIDAFIQKYNNKGVFQWAKTVSDKGQDAIGLLKMSPDGILYAIGSNSYNLKINPGNTLVKVSVLARNYILQFNVNGNYQDLKEIRSKRFGGAFIRDIDVRNSGIFYATGVYSDTIDFNPGPGEYWVNGIGDAAFTVKWSIAANIESRNMSSKWLIYPNPADNKLLLETSESILGIKVIDLQGSIKMEIKGEQNILDISALISGIYMVSITTSKGVFFKKFIKR